MKLIADGAAIKKALDMIRPGDQRHHADPRMRSVKIEARGKGVMEITTTDLHRWESIKVLGQQVEGTGSVTLSWVHLRKIMNVIKGDEVTVELDGEIVCMTSGETTMRLNQAKAEGFPATPTRPKDAIPVQLHLGALREVARFTSPDDSRPILTCAYYDQGTYVATDSYRLTTVEVPENATDLQFLIPMGAHQALGRLGSGKFVDAWVSPQPKERDATIWVDLGDAQVVARLNQGDFPGYKSLIPESGSRRGGLKATKEMRDASLRIYRLIKACGGNSYDYASPVKVEQVDGKTVLFAKIGDDTVEIKAVGNVEVSAAFNPRYLAEFFEGTNIDTIFGADSLRPWGLEEEADYCSGSKRTRLVMPVRSTF